MAAEGEVGTRGTSEFGRWNTEFEHKLNDWELREADHAEDQVNDEKKKPRTRHAAKSCL